MQHHLSHSSPAQLQLHNSVPPFASHWHARDYHHVAVHGHHMPERHKHRSRHHSPQATRSSAAPTSIHDGAEPAQHTEPSSHQHHHQHRHSHPKHHHHHLKGARDAHAAHPPATQHPVLTRLDLQSYIDTHLDLAGSVRLEEDAEKPLTDPDVIKSLVLVVAGRPWVVVLRGCDKLDLKKVATWLTVSKRAVRLATREETPQLCGFVPGTVPPLGHRQPLPTLVDQRVVALGGVLCGGGGDDTWNMMVDAQLLLQHTHARVHDVAVPGANTPMTATPTAKQPHQPAQHASDAAQTVPSVAHSQSAAQQLTGARGIADRAPAVVLQPTEAVEPAPQEASRQFPLPWAPGATEVELVAIVASKRRVAKLLQFCTLVPETSTAGPPAGQAVYLRRLWAHPEHSTQHAQQGASSAQRAQHGGAKDRTCEVQLIMGKTLERKLGPDGAAQIMDQMKPGVIVRITGHVQFHGRPTTSQPADAGNPAANTSDGSERTARHSSHVLDVVCHTAEVLYSDRPSLDRDLSVARQSGLTCSTASDLWNLRHTPGLAVPPALLQPATAHPPPTQPSSAASALHGKAHARSSRQHKQQHRHVVSSTETHWPGPQGGYQSHWVDDAAGVKAVRDHIASLVAQHQQCVARWEDVSAFSNHHPQPPATAMATPSEVHNTATSASQMGDGVQPQRSVGSVVELLPPPVALDCEWVPYSKGDAATPVALLQVATTGHVFLLDLLSICVPPSSSTTQDDSARPHDLAEGCQELGQLLRDIFTKGVTPIGFGLGHDLQRLVSSYPWLQPYLTVTTSSQQTSTTDKPGLRTASQPEPAAASDAVRTLLQFDVSCAQRHLQGSNVTLTPSGVQYVDLLRLARATRPETFLLKLGRPLNMSLARLVRQVLGSSLDKTCQASNWGQRPLTPQQLQYASLDVLCLIDVYDNLLTSRT